jgi:DNA-binding MarR family transcriptional regulator
MNTYNLFKYGYLNAIGPFALSVLIYLDYRAGKKGYCWPSINTIAKDLGMDKKTVTKAIKTLVWYGLINIEEQQRDPRTKKFKRTVYSINEIEQVPCRSDKPPWMIKPEKTRKARRSPQKRELSRDPLNGTREIKGKKGKKTEPRPVCSPSRDPFVPQSRDPLNGSVTLNHLNLQSMNSQSCEAEKSASQVPSFCLSENEDKKASRIEPVAESQGESSSPKGKEAESESSADSKPLRKLPPLSVETIRDLLSSMEPERLKDYLIKRGYDPLEVEGALYAVAIPAEDEPLIFVSNDELTTPSECLGEIDRLLERRAKDYDCFWITDPIDKKIREICGRLRDLAGSAKEAKRLIRERWSGPELTVQLERMARKGKRK